MNACGNLLGGSKPLPRCLRVTSSAAKPLLIGNYHAAEPQESRLN
jgi:hypothetical protein